MSNLYADLMAVLHKYGQTIGKSVGGVLANTTIPPLPIPNDPIISSPVDDPHGRFACSYIDWIVAVASRTTGAGAAAAKAFASALTSNFVQLESIIDDYPDLNDTQRADINAGVNMTFMDKAGMYNLHPAGMVKDGEFVPIPGPGDGSQLSAGVVFPRGTELADIPQYLLHSLQAQIRRGPPSPVNPTTGLV